MEGNSIKKFCKYIKLNTKTNRSKKASFRFERTILVQVEQIGFLQSVLSIDMVYSDLDWLDIAKETADNDMMNKSEVGSANTYRYL
jgi:hypothetical protein